MIEIKLYETLVLEDKESNGDNVTFNLSHYNLNMNINVKMMGFETSVNLDREQFSELLLFMYKEVEKHKKYLNEG